MRIWGNGNPLEKQKATAKDAGSTPAIFTNGGRKQ